MPHGINDKVKILAEVFSPKSIILWITCLLGLGIISDFSSFLVLTASFLFPEFSEDLSSHKDEYAAKLREHLLSWAFC